MRTAYMDGVRGDTWKLNRGANSKSGLPRVIVLTRLGATFSVYMVIVWIVLSVSRGKTIYKAMVVVLGMIYIYPHKANKARMDELYLNPEIKPSLVVLRCYSESAGSGHPAPRSLPLKEP